MAAKAERDPEEILKEVLAKDPRYRREAYKFMFEALEFTVNQIGTRRHVSGQELTEGIREYALAQFGGLTKTVFHGWGIRRTEDFGHIVFNLVNSGLMGKTDADSIDDFRGGYDFDEAFPIDYAP